MDKNHLFTYGLLLILLLLLLLAGRMLLPFLPAIIFALTIAYIFHPIYRRLERRLNRPNLSSAIMVVLVLAVIIVPLTFIIATLIGQSVNAYNMVRSLQLSGVPDELLTWTGLDPTNLSYQIETAVKTYFVDTAPNVLGSLAELFLGMFVMFFVMFFAFRDGERWTYDLRTSLPIAPKYKQPLFDRVGLVARAVVYGQFLTAVIQGSLGGILLWAFGVPNAVFWGFVMIILAFLPFFGTAIVWLPAGLWYLAHGQYGTGIGILAIGAGVVSTIDNVLRPYFIGKGAHVSALVAVLGVLGGLRIFGFVGLIIGPLILALLQTVTVFFVDDTEGKKAAQEIQKGS